MSQLLSYVEQDEGRRGIMGVYQGAKNMLKRVFGLPGGMTFWVKQQRTFSQKFKDARWATFQAGTAATSLGMSLYLANLKGADADIPRAAAALAAWVGWNMYEVVRLSELMNQGKRLNVDVDGNVKVVPGYLFSYTANALRSVITNFVVASAAFGLEAALSPAGLTINAVNTIVNTFARAWVDRIIQMRRGEWSPVKWNLVSQVWNFMYGVSKNLHLLGVSWISSGLYYVMGTIGLAKTLWNEKVAIKKSAARLKDKLAGVKAAGVCQTYLMVRTAESSG
jgi:hypothetical protein